MKRAAWLAACLAVLAYDLYLLASSFPEVRANLEAAVIWATPALIAHHVLLRRHADRRHAETQARLDAQDEALNTLRRDS